MEKKFVFFYFISIVWNEVFFFDIFIFIVYMVILYFIVLFLNFNLRVSRLSYCLLFGFR